MRPEPIMMILSFAGIGSGFMPARGTRLYCSPRSSMRTCSCFTTFLRLSQTPGLVSTSMAFTTR